MIAWRLTPERALFGDRSERELAQNILADAAYR
jgi:hypothetical protein